MGHGPNKIYYDNLGGGFRIECLCGFSTDPDDLISFCGLQMDNHLEDALDSLLLEEE